jgi:hypothetical protein
MIKGTYAEQKIKDAIQKLKEASFCIEDVWHESLQEEKPLPNGEWAVLEEIKGDIIECAMQLKEYLEE